MKIVDIEQNTPEWHALRANRLGASDSNRIMNKGKTITHLIKDFDGGPVGLDTLAAMTGEDRETLEDFCEPFLLRMGLLEKTSRGRKIPGRKFLSLRKKLLPDLVSDDGQGNMFD